MAELKVGMVVELKSGGPAMTIQKIYVPAGSTTGAQIADCQWFDGKKALSEKFPLTSLQEPEEPSSFIG